ncbi:hypothetical protein BH11CYA1_BH11CYA1_50040 [soil metagenome]
MNGHDCGLFWPLLSSILNCLMLSLMILAILSSIMGGAGNIVGSVLADGIQTIIAFVCEVLLRLLRLAIVYADSLRRLVMQLSALLFSYLKGKG